MRWSERQVDIYIWFCAIVVAALTPGALYAENSDQTSEVVTELSQSHSESDFFSEIDVKENKEIESDGRFNLNGFVKQDLHYAVRRQNDEFPFSRGARGFSSMRSTANLSLKGELFSRGSFEVGGNLFYDWFYHHSDKTDFSVTEYEMMADDAEWREVFVNFELFTDVWIKTGQQIIAWGESDYIQILDLANPRDEREFGLVDLEDARIPVGATRVSYVGERWGADVVLLHEFEANRWAGDFADFDPLIQFREVVDVVGEESPDVDLGRPDSMARFFLSFAGGDVSFIYGEVHDHTPAMYPIRADDNDVGLFYKKIQSTGIAANGVAGFWLFKTEFAHKRNVLVARKDWPERFTIADQQAAFYDERSINQILVGVEYAGYQDVQISLEGFTDRVNNFEPILARDKWESQMSGRVNFEFLRDTMHLELVWAHWFGEESDSVRIAYRYDWTDVTKLTLGYIEYAANRPEATLYPYKDGDRLFASIRYSF